ncbi:MAG: amidohydrolase [Myxococcota bacterium]
MHLRPRARPRQYARPHRSRSLILRLAVFSFVALGLACQTPSSSGDTASARALARAREAALEATVYVAREIVTLDPSQPNVEAVAIAGDRIIATGDLASVTQALAERPHTVDRRFEDKVLIPGLINQHEHALLAAMTMLVEILSIEDWELPERSIPRASNAAEYRARLKERVDQHPDPSRVFYTWGYHQLFHGELSRADLDALSTTLPIVVLQRSMHETIFNTAALERFGIDSDRIARLPEAARAQTDLANGHFWEAGSMAISLDFLGDLLAPKHYLPALERVAAYWHAAGSTLVAEPGGVIAPAFLAMQNKVLGAPNSPFRMHYIVDGRTVAETYPASEIIAETEKIQSRETGSSRMLPKQAKLFADGAMFSQLMKMSEGYLDGHHGEWIMEPELFQTAFETYWDAGYQIHVHQNGDAALDAVLDTLETNMARNPREDHRTVIVHFGFSRPDQVDRIAKLGALVSANPFYTVALGDRYQEVGIGPERATEMVRVGDVARAGIRFSLHADMPMAPGQPLLLMWAAVNRITVDGNLVGPNQRISPLEALRAVTIDAAYSLRLEDEVGSLVPGKRANLTVLTENPLTVPPATIKDIPIWGTVHEGRVLPVR